MHVPGAPKVLSTGAGTSGAKVSIVSFFFLLLLQLDLVILVLLPPVPEGTERDPTSANLSERLSVTSPNFEPIFVPTFFIRSLEVAWRHERINWEMTCTAAMAIWRLFFFRRLSWQEIIGNLW